MQECIERILKRKIKNCLCVLIDEDTLDRKDMKEFKNFCDFLKSHCQDPNLWGTCNSSTDIPLGWKMQNFTQPLNCPPEVIKEMLPADESKIFDFLPPTEGPPVKHIHHKRGKGVYSHDCAECGKEVAELLFTNFISRATSNQKLPSDDVAIGTSTAVTTLKRPSELQVKDLLIVLECDVKRGERFLTGVRESGIAVHFLTSKEGEDGSAKDGHASAMHVDGLYRYRPRKKIVVYVESKTGPKDLSARSRGMTSCASQLIVVRRNQE